MINDQDVVWIRKARNLPLIKKDIAPNLCSKPYDSMNIDSQGRIFICTCDGFLPFPVGHILSFETIEDVFNSAISKKIQNTIKIGTYEFCDTVHCEVTWPRSNLVNDHYEYDYEIEFGIDNSCNLHCPSCRPEMIFQDKGEIFETRMLWIQRLIQWISQTNKKIRLNIGANGEPFASPIYLEIFKENLLSNIQLHVRSNGTLIKRTCEKYNILPNLKELEISIDAATKNIYEIVRSPAKWENLLENIDYVVQNRKHYKFKFIGNFVIQKTNLDDMIPFIYWCTERNIYPNFTFLQNWSSFGPHGIYFDDHCVHRPHDKLYNKFLSIVQSEEVQKLKPMWLEKFV